MFVIKTHGFFIIHAAAFLDTHLAISNYFHEIYRDICNSNIKDILWNKKNWILWFRDILLFILNWEHIYTFVHFRWGPLQFSSFFVAGFPRRMPDQGSNLSLPHSRSIPELRHTRRTHDDPWQNGYHASCPRTVKKTHCGGSVCVRLVVHKYVILIRTLLEWRQ